MTRNEAGPSLKFSIKAHWAPLYVNRKLIAGRIMPLHRIDERLFGQINERGRMFLQEYYYSEHGLLCEKNDKRLNPVEFLKKNNIVYHALVVSYDTIIVVLGYNVFHYKCTKLNPPEGVHIDYFSSMPVNYPDEVRPAYLGNYRENNTFYRVRGVGTATIAMACCYAEEMHPKHNDAGIAVDLTARSDNDLIQKRYITKYGFELYKGKRGRENNLYLSYKKARIFLKKYTDNYKILVRPEGNGLTYSAPF